MSSGTTYYSVVIPTESTNLVTNPSFELGSVGWGPYVGDIAVVADEQAFGVWSARCRHGGSVTSFGGGIIGSGIPLRGGTPYIVSAYVRVTGIAYPGTVQARVGAPNTTGSTTYIADDQWTRVTSGTIPASDTTGTVIFFMNNMVAGTGGTMHIDGVQVEPWYETTYIDGDQEGCLWLGQPHASQSVRDGQSRAGGTVKRLADLGLLITDAAGVGMPPVNNLAQPRALLAGAEYQRTRADVRSFVLSSTMVGTTRADLHATRRRIIDAVKADLTTPQQPTRFLYTGAGETVVIDAVYAGGLDVTEMGVIDDRAAVAFTAFEPMWYGQLDKGTSLSPYQSIGSVFSMAWRDPRGQWGTFGTAGTTVHNALQPTGNVYHLNADVTGTLIVTGGFGTIGGTASNDLGYYSNGAFGTLGGTTTGNVYTSLWSPDYGTLYFGGNFGTAAGTTMNGLGWWRKPNIFGTFADGRPALTNAHVYALTYDNSGGLLVVGSALDPINGTYTGGVARWQGAWGSLLGGTVADAFGAVANTAGNIVVVGDFSSAGGTAGGRIASYNQYNKAWGTFAIEPPGDFFNVTVTPSQEIYAISDGEGIYRVRRSGIVEVVGITDSVSGDRFKASVLPLPDGRLLFGGVRVLGVSLSLLLLSAYNGYTWTPSDLKLDNDTPNVYAIARSPSGTLYVGGGFYGAGTAGFVAPVANEGMAEVYPVVQLRNTGAGTAQVYQLLNETTEERIFFDLTMLPGETVTLDLREGRKVISSPQRGNLINAIRPGSNLAQWRLLPGTNWVSFFSTGANVRADLYYRPRHWSFDGGSEPS